MTEEESARAGDIGEMFAVLPSIETRPAVDGAYAHGAPAPVGPYRSDGVEPHGPGDGPRAAARRRVAPGAAAA